ncbi:hypothetical protein SS1G_03518 [Sclerotinia sclerotiorum 1980 UF-70]|uniref:Peptidase S53 domain-containing protein n=1 Tax=Sclerotinia sclerotiorum (strain ATCC 18683 / 1980 / Ss-1) TaxID=665079 RepID=A7EDX8_SCLS1|nr:hypothetical protein SS1G_03518 [Sclerotinia sclerotiorum 1980 UF-70]EDO01044.1 hypothetical protein SS1G_03518 [Sclerotinia sclerotiorum 1980 UF-70]
MHFPYFASVVLIVPGIIAAALPSAGTHASRSSLVSHEKRNFPRTRWMKRDRIASTTLLPVRIGLSQNNLEKGHDFLMDVSHPKSSNYGKHWTAEQVHEMFAPSEEAIDTVRNWLVDSGIAASRIVHSDTKGWYAFDATTTSSKRSILEAGKGKGNEPLRRLKSSFEAYSHYNSSSLATCDEVITPECVKALYQIPPASKANPNNAMGIWESGDFYDQEDLNLFFANYTPYIPQGTHPTPNFVDGAVAPVPVSQAGGESLLDFELAYPLVYPQKLVLYQTDDINYSNENPPLGAFNTFLDAIDGSYCTYSAYGETGNDPVLDPSYPDSAADGYKGKLMCGVYKPTNVISTSYGEAEIDLPEYYMKRQCNEYLKLGLQGHTFLYSSGDFGVGGFPGDATQSGCLGPKENVFNPQFPVNCPYVTAVGATKVYPGHTVFEPESAANDLKGQPYSRAYSSGGGFSNVYETPSYQKEAVAAYFAHHNPPYPYYKATAGSNVTLGANGGLYNRAGRGIPDVSANGDNIANFLGGNFTLNGGTSASTPIFSSVINLINEERLAIGKSTVGFINPVLYANPHVLNDITNGSNPNCGTAGFSAVSGWDPVTGLGTPNYPKLLQLFLSLP